MGDGGRSVHPKALPNCENAQIARDKLEGYALNPNHEAARPEGSSGKNKARVFKAALGFDQSNWEVLKQRILEELPFHEAVFDAEKANWGKAFHVDMLIVGVNGSSTNVRTAWIIKYDTDYPSLVTLWVLPY
jgi:uncharacterized protein DUF6883